MVMLRFVPHQQPTNDAEDHQHYLTVTERMLIIQLAQKLLWIADRMTVIRNAERAL